MGVVHDAKAPKPFDVFATSAPPAQELRRLWDANVDVMPG